MRATAYLWWCPRGHRNRGGDRECGECGQRKHERHAQVHAQDRAVVYRHPVTGEYKTPARADVPMPEVYQKQGFERHEIMSMVEWEKSSGAVHEPTNYNNGNEMRDCEPPTTKAPPELIRELTRDIADAAASGPWTVNGLPISQV